MLGQYTRPSTASGSNQLVIGYDKQGKGDGTGFIMSGNTGGAIYQGNNSSTWSTTSDRRLKKNIVDNTTGLDAITQIQVRNFEYRTEDEITELDPQNVIEKQGTQLGVIAQEIQEILPDMVKEETTGVLSVDPDNMTWYLVNAVKELKEQLDSANERIAALESN